MSDIWDAFEKIAVEQGLITEAQETSEKPARYDSQSDDAIRYLYNLEPETIFDKNKTIIEIAHPETAVVGRAYDAMNAVIENLHQRQDMMAYIAQKMPNGHLTGRRYVAAKQDLVQALVRSAFTLDNKDEYELMSLADSCTERLVGFEKQAQVAEIAIPIALGVGAAALLLGGAYYVLYGSTSAQNVYSNSQKVLDALTSLMDKPYAQGIYTNVSNLMKMAEQIYAEKDRLSQVQSVNVAVNAAGSQKHQSTVNAINKKIEAYIDQLRKVYLGIPQWVSKIEAVHKTDTEEQSDWWAKITGLIDPLYFTADEKLIDRLWGQKNWVQEGRSGGLYEAIKNDIQVMSQVMNTARQNVQSQLPKEEVKPLQPLLTNEPGKLPEPIPAPEPSVPEGLLT